VNKSFNYWDNPWLCGFTDADGRFSIQLSKRQSLAKIQQSLDPNIINIEEVSNNLFNANNNLRLRLGWYIDQVDEHSFLMHLKQNLESNCPVNNLNTLGIIERLGIRYKVDTFNQFNPFLAYFRMFNPKTIKLSLRFSRVENVMK
jgi:hypothetical protein